MADMQIHPSAMRATTESDRIVSRHCFSFGPHYDPANLSFGPLLAFNEDVIQPGGGYPAHPHRETEIVTWVMSGALRHRDDLPRSGGDDLPRSGGEDLRRSGAEGQGGDSIVTAGMVQLLSAGTGVEHSELSVPEEGVLHLVQMWVRPDEVGLPPAYAKVDVASSLSSGELTPIVSGLAHHRRDALLPLRQSGAGLSVARLDSGQSIVLPDAALVHLFVTAGSVLMETDSVAESMGPGDAARITSAQGEEVRAARDAEILVWELAAD